MIRIHIICEGQTEETFVKELLNPYFTQLGIILIPTLIGKRGGTIKFQRLFKDIKIRLLGEKEAYCTTFFDFYGLPSDFPGKVDAIKKKTIADKSNNICTALSKTITEKIGEESVRRFIPYVQMYEFEGLLFSDPQKFAQALDKPLFEDAIKSMKKDFDTPEDINDSPQTAPSKRVQMIFSDYDKPVGGTIAALEIGLPIMRKECKLFDAWLKKLEALKAD